MGYITLFYVVPIFILPMVLPVNRRLFKTFAQEAEMGSFLYHLMGETVRYNGANFHFLSLRETYIFSLVVTNKIASTLIHKLL